MKRLFQSHSSVERACLLAAVHYHSVVSDDVDEMRGVALETAIQEDRKKGLIPFFVSVRPVCYV